MLIPQWDTDLAEDKRTTENLTMKELRHYYSPRIGFVNAVQNFPDLGVNG